MAKPSAKAINTHLNAVRALKISVRKVRTPRRPSTMAVSAKATTVGIGMSMKAMRVKAGKY